MSRRRKAWIAALLNLLFLGGGYVYLQKRVAFGWLLILSLVVMTVEYFIGNMDHFVSIAETHSISITLITFALAYDAYNTALGK